ncbi:rRNA methyltransferase 3, mitochondrial [Gryllus bimaculatus]|nr:rRNA methyltransferase 3, mitochondrial [Gryllus bimaculatus]
MLLLIMATTVKCAVYASRILKAQVKCVKIESVRHYPRWTHRRPAYIVENTCSKDEKERWKLNVEREIVRDSRKQKDNLENNLLSQSCSYQEKVDLRNQDSISHTLLMESFVGAPLKSHQSDSESATFSENEKSTNQKQICSEDSSKQRKFSGSVNDTRNFEDFSLKSPKESGKQRQQKILKKLKIFSEKEVETMLKMRQSAQKLGVPIFTDLGTDDTVLSQYLTNVKSKKKREKKHNILLEGKRLIRDAVDAGVLPEAVFFSRLKDLKDLNLPHEGVKIFKISYKKLSLWSGVATSPGVLAILNTPNVSKKRPASLPLTVICDNVRDPGNLGTILRICAGVGCRKVVLTKVMTGSIGLSDDKLFHTLENSDYKAGRDITNSDKDFVPRNNEDEASCVDLWDPKVLRAGAGSHFRLTITQAENWDDLNFGMDKNSYVCVAENNIVHHSLCQQERQSSRDREIESDTDEDDDDIMLKTSECSNQDPEVNYVPIVPYYALNYTSLPSIVLIVGGETEGICREAYEFVFKRSGVRVHIPLSNNVDSLNCSTALSIIAFEMKKQFLMKGNTSDPEVKDHADNSQNSKASIMNM